MRVFEAGGGRAGFDCPLIRHHDIRRVQMLLIVRPTGPFAVLLVLIGSSALMVLMRFGARGPERSQCWNGGSNHRNGHLEPEAHQKL